MAYYVRMNDPQSFRRDILESSKKIIGCLQANRQVKHLREQKRALLEQLQQQIKELTLLMAKLDDILPNKELREEAIQEARQREATKPLQLPEAQLSSPDEEDQPLQQEEPEEQPVPDEDEELKQALSSIEQRLKELS